MRVASRRESEAATVDKTTAGKQPGEARFLRGQTAYQEVESRKNR